MSTTDLKTGAIAEVYAKALYGLAREGGQAAALIEEVRALEALLAGDATFAAFLTDEEVDVTRRAATIEKTLRGRVGDTLVDALQVINLKGRMKLLPEILSACRAAHEEAEGIAEVEVRTAIPLGDDLRAQLTVAAEKHLGKKVRLAETVDESLLGGVILRHADQQMDTSLVRHLRRLHDLMFEHGERAIHGDAETRFIEGTVV